MPTPKSVLSKNLKVTPPILKPKGPLWKGPEVDGVTQSMLGKFLVCRERFRIRYIEGISPVKKFEPKIEFGNMWHVCEELFAESNPVIKGCENRRWADGLLDYAKQTARKYPLQTEEIDKWYNVVLHQFPVYADYWSKHQDVKDRTPLFQEQVFDVPYRLPSGRIVRLRGKWDSVDIIGKGKQAGIYLQENKTKSKIVERQLTRQLRFDLQTMTYLVALDEMHKSNSLGCDLPLKGVRYNVIRRDLPIQQHKDRNLKKGFKAGETVKGWCERLVRDYIAAEPHEWFMRWKVEVPKVDIESFKRKCLNPVLEQMCQWYDHIQKGNLFNPFEHNAGVLGDATGYFSSVHWQHPFGVYNILNEGGQDDLDEYIESGNMAGLRYNDQLFEELV